MSGRFQIVLADPPWKYRNSVSNGAAENHYRTLSTKQIAALPFGRLAADDCALFMWATWPMLLDALQVITAWGFTYKTCAFAWVKVTKNGKRAFGGGNYTRANTEICLLGTRGRPQRVDKGVSQVIWEELEESSIVAPVEEHSAKPAEARDRIVRLMGDVPRIELFARERPPGWEAWGDQVPPLEAA